MERLRSLPRQIFAGLPRREFVLLLLAGLVLCLIAVQIFISYSQRELAADMARRARNRLELYSGTLHSALSKYSYLPHIMATNPAIRRLVAEGDNHEAVNRYLADINAASGSMELFVLNLEGLCIAASNWNVPESFVGHDYNYRPYFQDALRKGQGGYFGVGATTGKPGFFFTEPIKDGGRMVGVAVTKVDLAILQREWRAGGETVFITDASGIIFLSSREAWRYKATKPLDDAAKSAMLYQRQYGNTLPEPVAVHGFQKSGVDLVEMDGRDWLYTTRPLPEYGWTIWFLSPLTELTRQEETLWFIGGGASFLLLLLALLARTLFAWARARRAAQEAEKIRAVNRRLGEEVRSRKKAERELLAAQDDLLHASRMAALGQVAASMVHELSQPVTSMGMFASSCRRLAQEGRQEKVAETVAHMLSLVQRIKSLIEQLRHFSRKSPGRPVPTSLREALNNALTVLQFKQEAARCVPSVSCPEDAVVLADALQLEQMCINLIHNALDAVSSTPEAERRISVSAETTENAVLLSITDNGPGIAPELRDKIFTPFFTTKRSGEGIGLGLAIVDDTVRSMRGFIDVRDVAPHGTRFTLRLPLAADSGRPA